MQIFNTPRSYGLIAKLLHWSVAVLIFALLYIGFYFDEISYGEDQFTLLYYHQSFGILVLWVVAVRILWRLFNHHPEAPATHRKWERILAWITHFFLYFAVIGMPVSGVVLSMSGGYDVHFFNWEVPRLMDRDRSLNRLAYQFHEILAYALIGCIILHTLGALKHHIIDRDNTLYRMLFLPSRLAVAALLLALGAFTFFLGRMIFF
jgi:cytochrome b561